MSNTPLPHDHGTLPDALRGREGEAFEELAEIFKLLDDGKRVRLFWILCHCAECVTDLSAMLGLSSPTVSHHLKLLKAAGLVVSHREGREVHYTAANTPRVELLHEMLERVAQVGCPVEQRQTPHYDANVHSITQVHDYLMSDLSARHTVEELSRQFHINPTTLKATFKSVYGQPIAAYVKARRIQKAQELLRTTDLSVAAIARQVGYENQSKFTQAFQSLAGMLPREYRKPR